MNRFATSRIAYTSLTRIELGKNDETLLPIAAKRIRQIFSEVTKITHYSNGQKTQIFHAGHAHSMHRPRPSRRYDKGDKVHHIQKKER